MELMDPILNPTVYIGNFEWREPVTTLTDFLVGVVCWYAFYKLLIYKGKRTPSYRFFVGYFLCFAIGMTCAAWLGHGLQAYISPRWKIVGWTMSACGLLCMEMASLKGIQDKIAPWLGKLLSLVFFSHFLVFVFLFIHPLYSDFKWPQLNSTLALVFLVIPMQLYNFQRSRNRGSLFIALTICYGIVPGLIFQNQISVNKWFNYHDISHVLMALFMYLMMHSVFRFLGHQNGNEYFVSSKDSSL